jgi:hypothetical protein
LLSTVLIGTGTGAVARSLSYTEPDGTRVVISLKYGSANITYTDGATADPVRQGVLNIATSVKVSSIELVGTSIKSTLTIKATAAAFGNHPYAEIGSIVGDGVAIGQIAASNVDIVGTGIAIDLGAKLCQVHDVSSTATLDFGTGTTALTLITSQLESPEILYSGYLKEVECVGWHDQTGTGSARVRANSIGKIDSADTFQANIVATSGGIGKITICGDLTGNLTSNAEIGNIFVDGGNLTGSLSAIKQIGNITVRGMARYNAATNTGDVLGGSITSKSIHAGDRNGTSIGKISLLGGGIRPSSDNPADAVNITTSGNIAGIVTSALKYVLSYTGGLVKDAAAVRAYQGGGVNASLKVTGTMGKISLEGGNLSGTLEADYIHDIKLQALLDSQKEEYVGAAFDASVLANYHMGNITVIGGGLTGKISAMGQIGNITVKKAVTNASLSKAGGVTTPKDAITSTGTCNFTLNLGVSLDDSDHVLLLNEKIRFGKITGYGLDVTIGGHISVTPSSLKIQCLKLDVLSAYSQNAKGAYVATKDSYVGVANTSGLVLETKG